jgi:hypothetical protein
MFRRGFFASLLGSFALPFLPAKSSAKPFLRGGVGHAFLVVDGKLDYWLGEYPPPYYNSETYNDLLKKAEWFAFMSFDTPRRAVVVWQSPDPRIADAKFDVTHRDGSPRPCL